MAAGHFWWPRTTEAVQKNCDGCVLCKMFGKNIKHNVLSPEKRQLPSLNKHNEEIHLHFIGPITEKNQRFYIQLSMNRFSDWPVTSLCTTTDGKISGYISEKYLNINGISKTNKTGKATAFTGRTFRDFAKITKKNFYTGHGIYTPPQHWMNAELER